MPAQKSTNNLRGEQGGVFVTGGSAEGSFACVVATTDVTLTDLVMPGFANVPASIDLVAGQVLYGTITGATVSGTAQFMNHTDPRIQSAIK